MSKGIITPNELREQSREFKDALQKFIEAYCVQFPAFAEATRRGFVLRVTMSNGAAVEMMGGMVPMNLGQPNGGGLLGPNGGLVH